MQKLHTGPMYEKDARRRRSDYMWAAVPAHYPRGNSRRDGSPHVAFRAEGLKDSPRTVVLMGTRLKVEYPISRGVRPHQCRKYWGLHRTGCKDVPRCRLCGDPNHRTAEHHSSGRAIKCANCNGQHTADSPSCPMTAPPPKKTAESKGMHRRNAAGLPPRDRGMAYLAMSPMYYLTFCFYILLLKA